MDTKQIIVVVVICLLCMLPAILSVIAGHKADMKEADRLYKEEAKFTHWNCNSSLSPLVSKEWVRENIVNIPQPFDLPDGVVMRQEPRVYASSCATDDAWRRIWDYDRTLNNRKNRCRYCGAKHTSEERECCKCGAPL